MVDEVKGHFQTAVRVISTSTSKQIDTMRTQYAEDILSSSPRPYRPLALDPRALTLRGLDSRMEYIVSYRD